MVAVLAVAECMAVALVGMVVGARVVGGAVVGRTGTGTGDDLGGRRLERSFNLFGFYGRRRCRLRDVNRWRGLIDGFRGRCRVAGDRFGKFARLNPRRSL